jgi:hypothetical protein
MSDRKYKQRGYQDTGAERNAPRPPAAQGPQDKREAPRGRGLGAPTEEVFRCARCGEAGPLAAAMALDAHCAKCGSDLHTCTHCASFDTGSAFECRKPIPRRISPKDRANACELFEPRVRAEFAREKPAPAGKTDDARAAFDALFKV